MDIMMARSNGVDVAVDVKARFAGGVKANATPMPRLLPQMVAMTANTSLSDLGNYKRAGFANVLGKPFDVGSLKAMLTQFAPPAGAVSEDAALTI